ncbi:hypothetical protein BCF11_4058 [Collimonas sp. PA-H2]|uniref:hypothetical protein n=1 Tax=Collimonas sp. PA-H2 TaxID=1881062 RepID=UPI000BF5D52A|nr:hypothetical protein [Collimonas sp. PA-H2]PFH11606.1 hypothetical protein BCF11_4058 [Collimonas sp. PA-H2]
MKIIVTRDSVTAGDDVAAPHRRAFEFTDGTSLLDALAAISRSNYLANISGGRATWSAVSGVPLAVIAQEWDCPQNLLQGTEESIDIRNAIIHIHFNYHVQINPDAVFEVLRGLRLKAY